MRTFRNKSRTGKTRIWRIEAIGDQVITEFGEEGGKFQRVADTAQPVNVGKSNEKSAEEMALSMANRQILLKSRAGYIEDGVEAQAATHIDFDALPLNLRFYKPDNSPSARMLKLIEEGSAWLGRKRDGEAFIVCVGTDGEITLYSRTMLVEHDKEPGVLWAERFPQIMADLVEAQLPPCTILLGELVMDRSDHNDGLDDFKHVSRVMKSLKDRALTVQEGDGWLSYYIWDVPFWNGQDMVTTEPFPSRYGKIYNITSGKEYLIPLNVTMAESLMGFDPNYYAKSPTFAKEHGHVTNVALAQAHVQHWEGYVVIDPAAKGYGDKSFNFRGKTDRPGKFCAKLKPSESDEFVAIWDPQNGVGEYGSGKYQGLIGSVQLYQYASAGTLIAISECGNGFTEADLKSLSDPKLYPLVFEVKYDERTYLSQGADTNALRFPRFLRVRYDKRADECLNPLLDC